MQSQEQVSNCIQGEFRLEEFSGFKALEWFKAHYGERPPTSKVVGSHKALGQGRSPAVDWAQEVGAEMAEEAELEEMAETVA